MNASFGWRAECDSHVQRLGRQVSLHPIVNRPADHKPRIQVEDHNQIQLTFARPDICKHHREAFLVWVIRSEVTILRVWRNVELVMDSGGVRSPRLFS
jgi:hypothetical protein